MHKYLDMRAACSVVSFSILEYVKFYGEVAIRLDCIFQAWDEAFLKLIE